MSNFNEMQKVIADIKKDALDGVISYDPVTMDKTYEPDFKDKLNRMTEDARMIEL